MAQGPVEISKIPTESPQLAAGRPARVVRAVGSVQPVRRVRQGRGPARAQVLADGNGRAATRGGGEVIELECGITVYPARSEGAGGGRSGTRATSGSSARRRARKSWLPSWRRSRYGWKPTRRA
jgi:hypothetical protein